jgi:hypothetical protein
LKSKNQKVNNPQREGIKYPSFYLLLIKKREKTLQNICRQKEEF